METTCMVKNCRYNSNHRTYDHKCGKCEESGHGMIECGNISMIEKLKSYNNKCKYCMRDKHMKKCPLNGTMSLDRDISSHRVCDIIDNIDLKNQLDACIEDKNIKNGEYTVMYGGMGCVWYIRKNYNINEYFFLHSDNQGQYGDDTSDIPRYNAFIDMFTLVE